MRALQTDQVSLWHQQLISLEQTAEGKYFNSIPAWPVLYQHHLFQTLLQSGNICKCFFKNVQDLIPICRTVLTQFINRSQTEQAGSTLVPFAKFKISLVQAKGIRLDKGGGFLCTLLLCFLKAYYSGHAHWLPEDGVQVRQQIYFP